MYGSEHENLGGALTWAYIMNWAQHIFTALVTLILAALLGPTAFGIVAMAASYILFIQILLDQGFVEAIIQKRDLRPEHLDSVFWMLCGLATVLLVLSISLSKWWASVNTLPELSMVIAALSLSLPVAALGRVQYALLQREMHFRRLAIRTSISVSVGGGLGVVMAIMGFGIWSLVAQQLCRELVATALLWKLSHWQPRFQFSIMATKDIIAFSTATFVGRLGIFVNTQADTLLAGIFFGPTAVGLYRFADRIASIVLQMTTRPLQTVSFPHFSRSQDDSPQLKDSVLFFLRKSSIITIPIMIVLASTSDSVVALAGSDWSAASDVLKLMCFFGALQSLSQFTGPLLQAISKPNLHAMLVWIEGFINLSVVVTLGIFLKYSPTLQQITGLATGKVAVAFLVASPLLLALLVHFCRISLKDILSTITPAVYAGTTVFFAAAIVSFTLENLYTSRVWNLTCAGILASVALCSIVFFDSDFRKMVTFRGSFGNTIQTLTKQIVAVAQPGTRRRY